MDDKPTENATQPGAPPPTNTLTNDAPGAAVNSNPAPESAAAPPAAPPAAPMCEVAAAQGIDTKANTPADFTGQIETSDELPSAEQLRQVAGYNVLDRNGKTHTFKSLYSSPNVARRQLVIFIRHFFCGNCQEYIRSLVESITTESLLALPVSTFITIIGCGDPKLISMYADATSCPFPIYTDPSGQLFKALGMTKTLDPGEKPAYMKKGMFGGALSSIRQGLGQVTSGLALKSGDFKQVGGEFLFEPNDISSPINTPPGETEKKGLDAGLLNQGALGETNGSREDEGYAEEKKVSWCHRMKTTRDHAEIPELMEILGLDGHGKPIKDEALWQKAVARRKGKGMSMAGEMKRIATGELEATKPVDV